MNEKLLTKFILSFLVDKEEYRQLNKGQQALVYETCRTIMIAIYNSIKHENVHPIIYCGDVQAHKIIEKAIGDIKPILPSTEKIKIHLIQ